MAHLGSWVPASKAEVPLTHRLLTRIQTVESISLGMSAFQVMIFLDRIRSDFFPPTVRPGPDQCCPSQLCGLLPAARRRVDVKLEEGAPDSSSEALAVASKVGLSAPLLERAAEFAAGRPQRICQEGVPLNHIHGLLEGVLDLDTNSREDVELLLEATNELQHT